MVRCLLGCVCLVLFCASPVWALNSWTLVKGDPKTSRVSVYHSFQEGVLLVAIENQGPFTCQPNRYLIFNAKTNQIRQIKASQLLFGPDFKSLVYLSVTQVGPAPAARLPRWEQEIRALSERTQASPALLEDTATIGGKTRCWQQPVLEDLEGNPKQKLEFLAANLCAEGWCNELQFEDADHLRLWAKLERGMVDLVRLNLTSGQVERIKQSKPFPYKAKNLEHAPRANLAASEKPNQQVNLAPGIRLILEQSKKAWVVKLLGPDQAPALAGQRLQEAQQAQGQGEFDLALLKAGLAHWLNAKDFEIRYFHLIALTQAGGTPFLDLEKDFAGAERKKACGRIHLDDAFKEAKQNKTFSVQFAKACP